MRGNESAVILVFPAVHAGVARRAAIAAPATARSISIVAPRPDTAQTVHEFSLEQFPPAARRLAR